MNKWELARYILDAKKSIDTVLYLSENGKNLSMIDIRDEVNEVKRKFYVNTCVVLDKCFPKQKKSICQDGIIADIYYERDKNYAHKDDDYKSKEYSSIGEMADEMKMQLQCVVNICRDFLPEELSLDYVVFDSKLFRIANGITKEVEEQILNFKHPNRGQKMNVPEKYTKSFDIFYDTEDINKIPFDKRKQYATIFSVGICMEETLQKLQDSAVRANVLFNGNIWISMSQSKLEKFRKMRALGLLDACDMPYIPRNKEDELRIIGLMKKEGLWDE